MGAASDLMEDLRQTAERQTYNLTFRPKSTTSHLQYMAKSDASDDYILVHRQKTAVFWNKVLS